MDYDEDEADDYDHDDEEAEDYESEFMDDDDDDDQEDEEDYYGYDDDEEEYDDEYDYDAYLALADQLGEVRQRGIPSSEISSLPERIYQRKGSENPESCIICLGELEEGVPLVSLDCKHEFHWDCGANWLAQNASCPVCRAAVRVNTPKNPVNLT